MVDTIFGNFLFEPLPILGSGRALRVLNRVLFEGNEDRKDSSSHIPRVDNGVLVSRFCDPRSFWSVNANSSLRPPLPRFHNPPS